MTKKKTLCLFFTIALTLSSFTGCGDKKTEKTDSPEVTQEAPAKETDTSTPDNGQTTQTPVSEEIPQYEGYSLLWNDEFNGDSLDASIWNQELRDPGWTNNELQAYTGSSDNVFVRDGKLILKAIKTTDANGVDSYTSGKVNSQNKADFMYGKVVASVKVPEGKGLWPAVWMMPKDESFYGQWPKCGEIDIMEVLGSRVDTAYGTIHYGEPHAEQQGTYVLENGTFASDFHEFSVEWEPGEMRFYIDGNLYKTVNDWFTANGDDEKPYPAPFNQPFFVQMNLAVGGNWPGNPDATTDFSKAEFEIDYVRVYQKPEYDTNVKKPEVNYREPLEDGNYIFNGDFSEAEDLADETNWTFLLFEGGVGAAEIKDNQIIITTENEGTVDYSVQLVQPEIPCIKGKKYKVSFDAYADESRDIVVCVSAPTAGWVRYLQDTTLTISTTPQTYTYEFEMNSKNDPNGRLEFNLGHRGSTATVYISNVRVEEIN